VDYEATRVLVAWRSPPSYSDFIPRGRTQHGRRTFVRGRPAFELKLFPHTIDEHPDGSNASRSDSANPRATNRRSIDAHRGRVFTRQYAPPTLRHHKRNPRETSPPIHSPRRNSIATRGYDLMHTASGRVK